MAKPALSEISSVNLHLACSRYSGKTCEMKKCMKTQQQQGMERTFLVRKSLGFKFRGNCYNLHSPCNSQSLESSGTGELQSYEGTDKCGIVNRDKS